MKLDADWIRSLVRDKPNPKLFELSVSERRLIARALQDLRDDLSLDLGTLLVSDPDSEVRAQVALGLGEIGYRTVIHAAEPMAKRTLLQLTKLAEDREWLVRANVPRAALQYGSEAVMPIVHGLTRDSEPTVRNIASKCYYVLTALHPYTAAQLATGSLQ